MTRWFALAFGLALAGAALYLLAASDSGGPAPSGEIDDASRARLERVLRDADRREGRTP